MKTLIINTDNKADKIVRVEFVAGDGPDTLGKGWFLAVHGQIGQIGVAVYDQAMSGLEV